MRLRFNNRIKSRNKASSLIFGQKVGGLSRRWLCELKAESRISHEWQSGCSDPESKLGPQH